MCVCEDEGDKVKKYWENLYKNLGTWSLTGVNCTTTVRDSLNKSLKKCTTHSINNFMSVSPEGYLAKLKNIKHGCGSNKGEKVKIKHQIKGKY